MTSTDAAVRHAARDAPLFLLAHGLLHLVDGLDGAYRPGLVQNLSYLAFLAAMILFGVLAAVVRPWVPPGAGTAAGIAATVTLAGAACLLWAVAGDLTGAFRDGVPVRIAGLLLLALGMLTLLGLLVASRRAPAWSPLLFGAGITTIIVDVGYLPLGALVILAALAPLARPDPSRAVPAGPILPSGVRRPASRESGPAPGAGPQGGDDSDVMLMVPSDVLRPRRPDEHFAPEARAAREAGITVALVDHDALAGAGDAEAAVVRVPAGEDAVYRGWMLTGDRYAAMVAALAARGVTMRTGARQYRRAHELPGWYAAIVADTPETVWTAGDDHAGFDEARERLGSGPAVLRDYTKSMKHYWHEAAFIPDVADPVVAWTVASRFRELRGDGFAGGFVLRRFEQFTGAEVRTWWFGGACRLVTAHPDTPDALPPADVPVAGFSVPDLPFVTVDLARRADGRWRVVEIGDGQVSDRPVSASPEALIAALAAG